MADAAEVYENEDTFTYRDYKAWELKPGEYSMRRYHERDTIQSGALVGLEISLPAVFEGL